MQNSYRCLRIQEYQKGEYSLVPIRLEDRYRIMQWRNEQISHLRQSKPLTRKDQDEYFNDVILTLFDQTNPEQILFSFLKNRKSVGYGGLVHIDWQKKVAEISFLIDTSLEKECFIDFWLTYLNLIEEVAFKHLEFNKIYTYSYEIRSKLYKVLDLARYKEEKRIKNVLQFKEESIDVLIHSKWKSELNLRKATIEDAKSLFDWANDLHTRKNSINPKKIMWNDHLKWLQEKINNPNAEIYIVNAQDPAGVLRIDKVMNEAYISFNVLEQKRGLGIGQRIISLAAEKFSKEFLVAEVLEENIASQKIFDRNKFILDYTYMKNGRKIIRYIKH